jgi:hypothetical protein
MDNQQTTAVSGNGHQQWNLNHNEANLLTKLRTKYRYGEIIIIMHDGIPQRLKRVEEFDDLHGDLSLN